MKNSILLLFLILVIITARLATAQSGFQSLDFLNSIKGQYIVSGQHNDQKNLECGLGSGPTGPDYWTEQVNSITGKYPGLWGGDFLFHGSANLRWDMTYEAEEQWNAGAIVNIMWHACPPTQGASCGWNGGLLSGMSTAEWNELLTDGTNLNNIWKARVDEIAVHLQYLEDAGVEVLWRPYHEQNQTAFWWNSQGAENTKSLWRMMHNYMTNDLGLTNLIWVWDIQDLGTGYANWNPGEQYWDIMALDIYSDAYTNASYYNDMVSVAGNNPIAIGECFALPSAQNIDAYPQYTFFMNWAYGLKRTWAPDCYETNTDNFIREVYDNPKVLTLDEMPGWGLQDVPNNLAYGKNVFASSTEVGNNVAENINDRRLNTRWSSEYNDDEWIYVDLEYSYALDSLIIHWEAAYASAYSVEVSTDAQNWEEVHINNSNTEEYNKIDFQDVEGRYVRVSGIVRATQYGYSIYEVELYGEAISSPFAGVPHVVPGRIEAEDFDLGGQGVAYNDLSAGNQYANYRSEDVDIEVCEDLFGGYSLGGMDQGEWVNYSVDVSTTGQYDITLRIASENQNSSLSLLLDGQAIASNVAVPMTGGWQTWSDLDLENLTLTEGEHILTLVSEASYFNTNYIEVESSMITSLSGLSSQSDMEVYPNPSANGVFHLRGVYGQYDVYGARGEIIQSATAQGKLDLDLSIQPSGPYIVKCLNTEHQLMTAVLIKD